MRGKKRPPEERVSNVAGALPPCKVCGEPAAGFHYGVNTCEACKGFFRRSLIRNGDYQCIGSGKCIIGQNRRKCCPKCRYLKCLSAGMSKEAIKTGRYTYMKRTQDTMEIKMLEVTKGDNLKDTDSALPLESGEQSGHASSRESPVPPGTYEPQQTLPARTGTTRKIVEKLLHNRISSTIRLSLESQSNCDTTSPPLLRELSFTTVSHSPKSNSAVIKSEEMEHQSDFHSGKSQTSYMTHIPSFYDTQGSMCSAFLSPPSAEESFDLSPSPQKVHQHHHHQQQLDPHSNSEGFSCSSLMSPVSCYTTSSAPTPASPQLVGSWELGSGTWQDYTEEELQELISSVVKSHEQMVSDSNNLPEEFFQDLIQECRERCHLQTEVFGHMEPIDKEEHDQIYKQTGLDVDGRLHDMDYAAAKMDVAIREMIAFMKLIPGFRTLCLQDQIALVKASIYDLCLLAYYRGYSKEDFIAVECSKAYCSHQLRAFYTQEYLEMIFSITHNLQQLHLTYEMVVILKTVCLFFPDRAELQNRDIAEALLFKMVQCLMVLLRQRWPDQAGVVLSRIISILTLSRSITEETRKLLKTMGLMDYKEFNSRPILIELFSGNVS